MSGVSYPCYWEKKDGKGQWYWIYYASNGEALARSSESYIKKSDCEHSVQLLKQSSNSPFFTD